MTAKAAKLEKPFNDSRAVVSSMIVSRRWAMGLLLDYAGKIVFVDN